MMVMGELIQINRIGCIGITEADCIELADRKTASLFSVCGKLGAVAAGVDSRGRGETGRIRMEPGDGVPVDRRHAGFRLARIDAAASRPAATSRTVKSRCPWSTRWNKQVSLSEIWWPAFFGTAATMRFRSQACWRSWIAMAAFSALARGPAVHGSRPADCGRVPRQPLPARFVDADRPGHGTRLLEHFRG